MVQHLWRILLLAGLFLALTGESPLVLVKPSLLPHDSIHASAANGYGYSPGDRYRFSDVTTETLDTEQNQLLLESKQTFEVVIDAIDEDVANYRIRITTRVANLAAGPSYYSVVRYMEGDSPVVAGPEVYFTHTNWNLHLTDWELDANTWQQETQMYGSVFHDLDQRFFSWNLTRYVDSGLSQYDADGDGAFDSYDQVHCYAVQFDTRGVVELRSWYTQLVFACGALYMRVRAVTLLLAGPDSAPLLSAEAIFLGVLIASLTLALVIAMIRLFRQSSGLGQGGKRKQSR